MRVGVIDIGTLKVKFMVAEVKPSGKLITKYKSNNLTGLGVNIEGNGGRPEEKRLKDTILELKRCGVLLEKDKVRKFRVVSTHALREMGSIGSDIAKRIENEVGLKVEIISQKEEAELFFNAVVKDFQTTRDFTLVDVGGGSVQILIGNKNKLKGSYLLKTGTATLWGKFTPKHTEMDFPKRSEIRKMKNYILEQLQPIPMNLKTPLVYGSSCIIDLFKGIGLPLQKYTYSDSNPYKANLTDMENFLENVWEIPYEIREEKYLSPTYRYMWGVDKAFLNVVELAKKIQAPYIIPTNSNINQGLIQSLIK